jgi:hypothetical protein
LNKHTQVVDNTSGTRAEIEFGKILVDIQNTFLKVRGTGGGLNLSQFVSTHYLALFLAADADKDDYLNLSETQQLVLDCLNRQLLMVPPFLERHGASSDTVHAVKLALKGMITDAPELGRQVHRPTNKSVTRQYDIFQFHFVFIHLACFVLHQVFSALSGGDGRITQASFKEGFFREFEKLHIDAGGILKWYTMEEGLLKKVTTQLANSNAV